MKRLLLLLPLLVGCGTASPRMAAVAPGTTLAATSHSKTEVALGFRLFFDPRLSSTDKVSCATCHKPKLGFSNGEAVATGVHGRKGQRNTPTIYAAARSPFMFWDGRARTLEEQALGPIQNPDEMGSDLRQLSAELEGIRLYSKLFRAAYGTPPNPAGIGKAIAAFERALEVGPSPFDRWMNGENTLSPQQLRGQELFSVKGHCGACHKGLDLSDGKFHNLGVGMDQPNPDLGRFLVTGVPSDRGAFKTPTLRNVAQSGPYMHDGSLKTLADVVEFYDKGGIPNAHLDPEIRPLNLSREEKADLVAFLEALSGRDNLRQIGSMSVDVVRSLR